MTPPSPELTSAFPDPGASALLAVRVLGRLEVLVEGRPVVVRGALRRRILLCLIAAGARDSSLETLAEALWGPDGGSQDRGNAVHAHVSRLRRDLGTAGGRLRHGPDGYRLETDWVDASALLNGIEAAEDAVTVDPARAWDLLAATLDAWQPPTDGDGATWDAFVRAIDVRIRGAQDAWADLAVRLGRVDVADRLVDLARADPTREVRWCLAMRALAAAGRRADALETYRRARRLLVDEYGVEPGDELRLTHAAVLREEPGIGTRLPRRPVSVPRPITRFVGRTEELRVLDEAVAAHRIVTVCGMGGIGKSRLLAEWVHRGGRAGSAHWVDLRAARPGDVLARISAALGCAPASQDHAGHFETILAAIGGVPTLLVLDNAEDLVDEVAAVAAGLAHRSPQVTILVTSRSALGLGQERLVTLTPLSRVAAPGTEAPAIELARSRLPGPARLEELTRIATLSDGVPLAVEVLAAAPDPTGWDTVWSPTVGLGSIVAGAVDGLSTEAYDVLRALAMLPAGAPESLVDLVLEYALQKSRPRGRPIRAGRRALRELVGASLVVTAPAIGPTGAPTLRHHVLAPIADVLVGPPEGEPTAAYLALSRWVRDRTRESVFEVPPGSGLREVAGELPTVQAALHWWRAHDPTVMVDLAVRLGDYWLRSSRTSEGRAWVASVVDAPGVDPLERAAALLQCAAGRGLARMAQELPLVQSVISLLEQTGMRSGALWAMALAHRAVARGWRGDVAGMSVDLAEARAAADPDAEWFLALLDQAEALGWAPRGEPGRGIPEAVAAADRMRELGDHDAAAIALYFAANLSRLAGDDAIESLLAQARELATVDDWAYTRALIAGEQARCALERGRDDAVPSLEWAIRCTELTGNLRTAAIGRRDLGIVHLHGGRVSAARHQLAIAARRLVEDDPGAGGLALAALASLTRGPDATALRAAAWALTETAGRARMSVREQGMFARYAGDRPDRLPEPQEVADRVIVILDGLLDGLPDGPAAGLLREPAG